MHIDAKDIKRKTTARQLAVEVLNKVDTAQAYANLELDLHLRRSSLSVRDRALATELVYGTLRWRKTVDRCIEATSNRPLHKLNSLLRAILRITAYQLFFLTSIPPHAAVYESVELAKRLHGPGAARFVNATARHMQRSGIPSATGQGASFLASKWSHPQWLVEKWLSAYGWQATEGMLITNQQPPTVTLRVNTLCITRAAFLEKLQQQGVQALAGATPDAIKIVGSSSVTDLPGYKQGEFIIQDEASQLAAYALQPQPGEVILDMCSAPGGKATHLCQLMKDHGTVYALELHPHRTALIQRNARRLKIKSLQVINHDSRHLPDHLQGVAKRILLDAPCSGTGVLRRRVDLRWRLNDSDFSVLTQMQRELLDAAAIALVPNGRLIYSTCSVEPEENKIQVKDFLNRHPNFRFGTLDHLVDLAPHLIDHKDLTAGELQLLSGTENDGFYIACLEKEA